MAVLSHYLCVKVLMHIRYSSKFVVEKYQFKTSTKPFLPSSKSQCKLQGIESEVEVVPSKISLHISDQKGVSPARWKWICELVRKYRYLAQIPR
mmetsp:Transcript_20703/g.43527  ORF Transcript_20703/g.43527 Transcript_20703/m.43527 type:complete len:94 (+) Transcript_20703:398-679(+)